MADISENVSTRSKEELLKLLYNFKSDDSCVLRKINQTITKLEEEKNNNEEEKAQTEQKYTELKEDKRVLGLGEQLASNFFSVYDDSEDLQHYFRLLNIDLDPSEAKRLVNEESQNGEVSEVVDQEIFNIEETLQSLDEHKNELEISIAETVEKLSDAEHIKNGLSSLIDDVLNDNNSYNRGYVRSILEGLSSEKVDNGFSENEIIELSQLIIFPEIGLSDFEARVQNGELDITSELTEVVEPINEEVVVEKVENSEIEDIENVIAPTDYEEAPILENISAEKNNLFDDATEPQNIFDDIEISNEEKNVELTEDIEESVLEEQKDYPNENIELVTPEQEVKKETVVSLENEESLESYLSSLGLKLEELSLEKKEKIIEVLENVDRDLIKKNLEELNIINADNKIIYMVTEKGYSYLADQELSSKINFLREKNISESTIKYALLNKCIAESSLTDIKRKINDIEANNESLSETNILIIKNEPNNYYENLAALRELGIEPDEKELRYCRECFSKYGTQILEDTQVLKEYGININRKNGKYELEVYWKTPRELVNNVDDIIEIGEEDLLNTTPEALGIKTETVLSRIEYCKENNIPYYDVTAGKGYEDFIYKPLLFNTQFGNPKIANLASRKSNNDNIRTIGKEQNEIISILNDSLEIYYDSFEGYKTLEISEQEVIDLIIKLKNQLEVEIGAEVAGKNTYRISGEYISRNKFERNLNALISKLLESNQDIEGISKEIIFVAMLFDSRKSEDAIRNIANVCLGFNKENEKGGPTL